MIHRITGLLALLLVSVSSFSQTQFIDQYAGVVVTSANTTGTSDAGWITVADIKIDSVTERLAVMKFDMCGDLEWSNFYFGENLNFHHAEIIERKNSGYYLICGDSDLSQREVGYFLLTLDNGGQVTEAINFAKEDAIATNFNIGPDIALVDTATVIAEIENGNTAKCLGLFEDGVLQWAKSYEGLSPIATPMAIEALNDTMTFVTTAFEATMLDSAGEVIWSMKNDSVVIWPEIAHFEDNTVGILVSPLRRDSAEIADNRRYVHLVTFPQGLPLPVMHQGDIKISQLFPELHAVDGFFIMASIDSIPEENAFAQTFTIYDSMGTVTEQKYLTDFLTSGPPELMPFIGFDFVGGQGYVTYADRDSNVYFGRLGASMEVEDPMGCTTTTRDSLRAELDDDWYNLTVTTDSMDIEVDTVEIMVESADSLFVMMRQCENEIPDGEVMQSICPGDSILIGDEWIKEEGTYMDTMQICGEDIVTTYEVTFIELPDASKTLEICEGDTIERGGQLFIEEGEYVVTFFVCGQNVDTTYTIVFKEFPDLEKDTIICQGDPLVDGGMPIEVEGRYDVLNSMNECNQEITITYNVSFVPPSPDPAVVMQSSCPGATILHNDRVNGDILITSDTSFSIEIPDVASGCPNYMLTQAFEYRFNEDGESFDQLIPRAFTPNNDGMNDRFMIKQDTMLDIQVEDYEMKIFNRWGQLVFTTNDFTEGWDGRHDGDDPLSEVYLYVINFEGTLNQCEIRRSFTGDVTLIR